VSYGEQRDPANEVPGQFTPGEPATAPRRPTTAERMSGAWVTWTLIAACVIVFIAQSATNVATGSVTQATVFYTPYAVSQPWRFITALFAHANIIHIGSNMLSLFFLGPQLERVLGHWRFAALYFLAGIGGGVLVEILLPAGVTLGASGAIFGLLGAYFVIARRIGANLGQIAGLIVLNLAIGFIVPSIAWQAHIGGLLVGGLVAWIYGRPRSSEHPNRQLTLLALVLFALAVIAVAVNALR
jgi:membrane associated rhomboid family serine protease